MSVAFDEVTVRERIIVEGGVSGFVLSQFDGPVTMTRQLRVKGKTTLDGQLRVTFNKDAVNANTGSAVIKGGVGVGGNSWFQGSTVMVGQVRIDTGAVPQKDQTSYLGTNTFAFDQAHIGDIQVGAAASTTISTRNRGLLIEASGPDADGDLTLTSKNNNVDINAKKDFDLDAETGGFDLQVAQNIDINAGIGKSVNVNESTYIEGDLEVKGQGTNVPPGDRSGTIRANYLEVPNVTPVGSIVLWAGNKTDLPTGTVNGSIVTNWAVCDGQSFSRTEYSALFNILGTKYNKGNDSNAVFRVPDLRNKFPIGSHSDNGANLETDDEDNALVKRTGGSKDAILKLHNHPSTNTDTHSHDEVSVSQSQTLTMTGGAAENGGHDHGSGTLALTATGSGHSHQYDKATAAANSSKHFHPKEHGGGDHYYPVMSVSQSGTSVQQEGTHGHGFTGSVDQEANHTHQVSVSGADHDHSFSIQSDGAHGHTVQNSGEDATNKNLPPYFALWYIIRII